MAVRSWTARGKKEVGAVARLQEWRAEVTALGARPSVGLGLRSSAARKAPPARVNRRAHSRPRDSSLNAPPSGGGAPALSRTALARSKLSCARDSTKHKSHIQWNTSING